ncbi:protein involved in gliding motility GldI [Lutibacter oricola]|uniref:Peptidyl-prolyl cis-trans isomerase n=1 Tax=Lutibacter oricola TaxID=762486 RepID=A0A1H3F1J9_9FLAO|nr:gliding motility-associated peptidyl-prolyl isomerase GldI [Lutibacter oricola]SDX84745.1 protein involved in gliding motility GldI [Lutibacter oricola]
MRNSFLLFLLTTLIISCMNPVPRKPVTRKTTSYLKESVNFNKTLIANEEEELKSFIKQDSLTAYQRSASGFWYAYELENKANNYLPKFGDELEYVYEVYAMDNSIIYSAEEIGKQGYKVDQQEIVEGLRNGLKLMKENEIVTFLFPSHKMYGYLGDRNKIGINEPLKVKVQLIKTIKKNESN